ncbi:MAG: hypothetical protein R2787_06030 [Saprospiraceae bacterium]|nr:hypothetical protein [Lewinellaceae bacterium]
MNSCIDFIEERSGEQQAILIYLYELFLQWEGVRPRMAFGIPFFYGKKWICYLNPLKDGGVEVVFTRARELSNANGLLEAKGRKLVMGVTYRSLTEIREESLLETWEEALALDRATPGKGG